MKKYYFLIMVALILGLVLTGCSLLSNVGQVPAIGQKGMPLSTANLVALWHFDENSGTTAHDSTENNNDGTISGASWVDGKLGKSLSFDGNDYVIVPDSSLLEPDRITVEAWVKSSGTPGSYKYIVSKYLPTRPGNYSSYGLYTGSSGGLRFYIGYTSSWVASPDAGVGVWDDNWHHVAGTYDGSAVKLYVDGEQVTGIGLTTSDILYEGTGNLFIGAYTTTSYCFSGTIDEVRIWDGALAADEIFYSYNNEILHVDDDWAQWPGAYRTITEALAVSGDGDTIIVEDGTYAENLIISKANLTLKSETNLGAIIKPTSPGTNAVYISADGVTIDGFEIDGTTLCKNGILGWETSGLTIKNNEIHGAVNAWDGCGILLFSWGNAGTVYDNLIENNEVYNTGRMGIMVMDYGGGKYTVTSGNTITGNTVHDVWNVAWGDGGGGIQINVGKDCAITDNLVYDVQSSQRGIYMFGSAVGNTITGNTLRDNAIGIQIWISGEQTTLYINWGSETPTSPQVHLNNIYNNSLYGAKSTNIAGTPMVMDATCNWWGENSGPSDVGPGTGDAVSVNVDYNPWLTDEGASLVYTGAPQPETLVVLEATLVDSTSAGILGMEVEFFLNDQSVGIATTNSDGVAIRDIGLLEVGIYEVYAETSCGLKSETEYLAVYPLSEGSGFVTGGGWIDSPAGAYVSDPSAEGKASFGFVSKYQKGATIPTGNTEFQFKAGNLNFHSDNYEWLVVAGDKAMYKGTGTINGTGDYGFMLSATDSDPDLFRIKIQDKITNNVIYDNHQDGTEGTVVAGGQIIIHKGK